jgi:hypothetical protein
MPPLSLGDANPDSPFLQLSLLLKPLKAPTPVEAAFEIR